MFTFLLLLIPSLYASNVFGPLTSHFQEWLKMNDYGSQGSFGGRLNDSDEIKKYPIIFIHGNSDSALHTSSASTGWSASIEYFLSHGFTTSELYATSWEDNNAFKAFTRTHNCGNIIRLRKFVEAVLKYTGSAKVSIIAHSMGVTLSRKVVKGGRVTGSGNSCDIGPPLTDSVDAFIGISGANHGLCTCTGTAPMLYPTCSKTTGFYPGEACNSKSSKCGEQVQDACSTGRVYSSYLTQLNTDRTREAARVYSIWSQADDLILNHDSVWGAPTSLVPSSDSFTILPNSTHIQSKDDTSLIQWNYISSSFV